MSNDDGDTNDLPIANNGTLNNNDPAVKHVKKSPKKSANTQKKLAVGGVTKKMGGGTAGYQWTPHKRRGPIAAEFSGPGPAAIALPSLIGSKLFTYNLM